MTKVTLSKNYRFCENPEMLKLDKSLRGNAAFCFTPTITDGDVAKLPVFLGKTQQEEAELVVAKVQNLIGDGTANIAILFRSRGRNAQIIEAELKKNSMPYFYGMFTDEDADYIEFHYKCQEMFEKRFGESKSINKKALMAFSESVKIAYATVKNEMVDSLILLLDALVEKVAIDYADLVPEDKYTLLMDIFENCQLKQAMEYIKSKVILSTVHGAKGLEWDYVIVCDVEQWVFTFICKDCPNNSKSNNSYCKLPQKIPKQMVNTLLDDFCVFYVALTRAKKQAFISASAERYNAKNEKFTGGKICCFALVDGVKLIDAGPKSVE